MDINLSMNHISCQKAGLCCTEQSSFHVPEKSGRPGQYKAHFLPPPPPSPHTHTHTHIHQAPAHNYSTQALNSTELAKSVLKEKLATDPAHRYTYCQHYHSMTVVPIDVEAEQRARRCVTSPDQNFSCIPSQKIVYGH